MILTLCFIPKLSFLIPLISAADQQKFNISSLLSSPAQPNLIHWKLLLSEFRITLYSLPSAHQQRLNANIAPVSEPAALEARHIEHGFANFTVLHDICLKIQPGEVMAITGPSGSGKSTLLHLLGGLDVPDQGEVWWAGERVDHLDTQIRAQKRAQQIGLIFQHHYLLEDLTIRQNVQIPKMLSGGIDDSEALLERVGLFDRANELPKVLSGGERQRVAVARALAARPTVVLADEPTGSLDRANADRVAELLVDLAREHHAAVILVTHDPSMVTLTDRQLNLLDGQIVNKESLSVKN